MKLLLHFQWILLLTFFALCFLETNGRGGRGGGGRGGGGRGGGYGGGGGRSRGSGGGGSGYGRGSHGSSSSNQKYGGSYGSGSTVSSYDSQNQGRSSDYTTRSYNTRSFSTKTPYIYRTRQPDHWWIITTPATTPKPLFSFETPVYHLPNFEHRESYEPIIKFKAPDFKNLQARPGMSFEEPKFQRPNLYQPRRESTFNFQTPSYPENYYLAKEFLNPRDQPMRSMRNSIYKDQQPAHNPFFLDTANDPFLRNFRKKRSSGNDEASFNFPGDQLPSFVPGQAQPNDLQ